MAVDPVMAAATPLATAMPALARRATTIVRRLSPPFSSATHPAYPTSPTVAGSEVTSSAPSAPRSIPHTSRSRLHPTTSGFAVEQP